MKGAPRPSKRPPFFCSGYKYIRLSHFQLLIMTWSNGKSGKGGNRYRKTKWTNPRPSRTPWVNHGYSGGAQRQSRQRSGGGSFVANRSYSQYNNYSGNGYTQRRKASSGPRRSYSGGGSARVGYNTAKKATAETFCVEVNTDNGVRVLVLLYFVAFLTLVVLAGRGSIQGRECSGFGCPPH